MRSLRAGNVHAAGHRSRGAGAARAATDGLGRGDASESFTTLTNFARRKQSEPQGYRSATLIHSIARCRRRAPLLLLLAARLLLVLGVSDLFSPMLLLVDLWCILVPTSLLNDKFHRLYSFSHPSV